MMPTQSRPHSAVFPSSFFSYIFFSSLLSLSCHLYIKAAPVTMLGSESDERTGLAGLSWAGLGWSSCLVTTETNDVLSWTLALLLLVPIYTATLPPSIQEISISGNICTVQSVISISRCLQSSSCLTTWFYRLLFSCPKWTNGSVFVNTISLGVHGESFPFAISVKYFLCFSCCQISIPLD